MILFPALEYLITPVAFIGAMLAAIAIYILAWKNGIKPVRIILAGVAVSAFLSAGISGLLVFYSDRVNGALMWMVGGLAARSWPHVTIIVPYALIGLVLAIISAHYLNILQLGDEMAKGLGVNVEVTRIALTAIAALRRPGNSPRIPPDSGIRLPLPDSGSRSAGYRHHNLQRYVRPGGFCAH